MNERFNASLRLVKEKICQDSGSVLELLYRFTGSRYESLLPAGVVVLGMDHAVFLYLPSDHPTSRKAVLFEPFGMKDGRNSVMKFSSVRALSKQVANKLGPSDGDQFLCYIVKKRPAAIRAKLQEAVELKRTKIQDIENQLRLLSERENMKKARERKTETKEIAELQSKIERMKQYVEQKLSEQMLVSHPTYAEDLKVDSSFAEANGGPDSAPPVMQSLFSKREEKVQEKGPEGLNSVFLSGVSEMFSENEQKRECVPNLDSAFLDGVSEMFVESERLGRAESLGLDSATLDGIAELFAKQKTRSNVRLGLDSEVLDGMADIFARNKESKPFIASLDSANLDGLAELFARKPSQNEECRHGLDSSWMDGVADLFTKEPEEDPARAAIDERVRQKILDSFRSKKLEILQQRRAETSIARERRIRCRDSLMKILEEEDEPSPASDGSEEDSIGVVNAEGGAHLEEEFEGRDSVNPGEDPPSPPPQKAAVSIEIPLDDNPDRQVKRMIKFEEVKARRMMESKALNSARSHAKGKQANYSIPLVASAPGRPLNSARTVDSYSSLWQEFKHERKEREGDILPGPSCKEGHPISRQTSYRPSAPEIEPSIRITSKSNMQVVINAITNVCLAGHIHMRRRENVIRGLQDRVASGKKDFQGAQFIILVRSEVSLKFRGVYLVDRVIGHLRKLQGAKQLPQTVSDDMIESFYKYNTGQRNFTKISTKSITKTTDAVALDPKFFQQ